MQLIVVQMFLTVILIKGTRKFQVEVEVSFGSIIVEVSYHRGSINSSLLLSIK